MREAEERVIFQNAVDRRLSGLQENPFLAQRIMNAEKGEIKVKKKHCVIAYRGNSTSRCPTVAQRDRGTGSSPVGTGK